MFWFDVKGIYNKVFLIMFDSFIYYFLGFIIWGDMDRCLVDWIWDGGMRDFGVIWYWVNEDDCDEDRRLG